MDPLYNIDNLLCYIEDNTLYEETSKMSYYNNYPPATSSSSSSSGGHNPPPPSMQQQHNVQQPPQHHVQQQQQQLKRKMTLDLNTAIKRPRFPLHQQEVLSSPDVQKLQIPTPELDRLIMSTTNPNVLQTPTSVFFPKNVTEEQELYAKGFEHALKQLHESQNNTTSSSFNDHDDTSSASSSYTTSRHHTTASTTSTGLTDFSNVVVKEEPQTVPEDDSTTGADDDSADDYSIASNNASSNISPIDMESQEKIKLERKRQRNRLAASKCRRKKLERIAKLEEKVKQLKGENNELGNVLVKLRESVQLLKSQVMEHVQAGCPIVVNMGGGVSSSNFS